VNVSLRRPIVITCAALAVLLVAVAYILGAHRDQTHSASGTAYSTDQQITVSTGGWTYDIPLQVPWRDADGVLHQGSRPACLPPAYRTMPVKFRWVPANADRVSWRVVVWVDCD